MAAKLASVAEVAVGAGAVKGVGVGAGGGTGELVEQQQTSTESSLCSTVSHAASNVRCPAT